MKMPKPWVWGMGLVLWMVLLNILNQMFKLGF